MDKLTNIIGFIGKSGSGKSYLANVAGEISGLPVIEHKQIVREIVEMPVVRQIVDFKRKHSDARGEGEKVLDFVGDNDFMLPVQFFFMARILNFKLKRNLDPEKPAIIAFQALPLLPITKDFAERVRIYNPNENERLQRIAERDGVPFETVLNKTKRYEKLLNFDGIKYDRQFPNTGEGLPTGFVEYAESLRQICQ